MLVKFSDDVPASRNDSGTHPSRWIVSKLYFSTRGRSTVGLKMSSYFRNFRPNRRIASATPSNALFASLSFALSCSTD